MTGVARVLILHDYAGSRGGAERIALDLRRGLRERGIAVRLMTSDADPSPPGDEAPDLTCRGSTGPARALREMWNPDAARRLRRELAQFRPDIVHVMMFLTQLSPAILPVLRGWPVAYTAHTYRAICPTGLRWRAGQGICHLPAGRACGPAGCFGRIGLVPRRAQLALLARGRAGIGRLIVPSRSMAGLMAEQGWPADHVVPHAVPLRPRAAPQGPQPVIAFAGRLVPEKGVDWLIRAVGAAGGTLGGAEVLILGDGPDRARLEALAAALPQGSGRGRVRFAGHLPRDQAEALLDAAWAQVVPSLWPEPFGLVVAEAMARGTAVIASDAGAPSELVDAGATGLVVPSGDTGALAAALVAIIRDPALARQMGEAGRLVAAERFRTKPWIDAHLAIYSDMLAARKQGRAA